MNREKEPLTQMFEEALSKSIEANKVFMNEGSRIFRRLGSQEPGVNKLNVFRPDMLTTAFREYVKLNLTHYNNLVELSLKFLKQAGDSESVKTEKEVNEDLAANPGFILEKETEAGQSVQLQFLLDNIRQAQVTCELVHSGFVRETDPATTHDFYTQFTPQTFDLKAGESRSVDISLRIPANTVAGVYTSKVQVKGFEPAYFLIRVTVTETQKQQTPDGGQKEKSIRK